MQSLRYIPFPILCGGRTGRCHRGAAGNPLFVEQAERRAEKHRPRANGKHDYGEKVKAKNVCPGQCAPGSFVCFWLFLTVQFGCLSKEDVFPGVSYFMAMVVIMIFVTRYSNPGSANSIVMRVIVHLHVI